MTAEKDYPVFEISDDEVENKLDIYYFRGVVNISIFNKWAGDSERGFGETTHIRLSPEGARKLARWILKATKE